MPLYEYACEPCGSRVEVRHGIKEAGPTSCPACGGTLRRVFTAPRVNAGNYSSPSAARYAKLSESEEIKRGRAEHESVRISDPLDDTPPA